jgi:hypothetical protein
MSKKLDGKRLMPHQSTKMRKLDSTTLLSEIPKAIFSADGSAHHQRNAVKKLTQRPHQI